MDAAELQVPISVVLGSRGNAVRFFLDFVRSVADEYAILCGNDAGKYSYFVTCGLLYFCDCVERSC